MRQADLFNDVCEKLSSTSSSDVDLTVSTSTEATGQTPIDKCNSCGVNLEDSNWSDSWKAVGRTQCTDCSKKYNDKSNNNRMYVNGRYVPQTHPLYKAGRYQSFDDAAFSSLQNYERSSEGKSM